jgi:glycosyltransferase involved in cell wall biosynthesis
MTKRPRVVHAIPFLWSGAGAVVTRLCESQRNNYEVHLVTSAAVRGLRDWPAYRRRLAAAGVEHHRIDLFSRQPDCFWPAVCGLSQLVRELRPRVVHAHAGTPTLASVLASRTLPVRVPVVAHMYSWGEGRPAWMNEMDGLGFTLADAVIVSAETYRRRLIDLGVPAATLRYVPWGLPLEELDATRARRPQARSGPRIGFVGRVEPRKGQLELVRAFELLARRLPGARLDLVGPTPDAEYARSIKALCRTTALAGRVSLKGYVRDPWAIMRQWDLFASLSSDEGQGLAILEAMALGVPVAALPVAGVEDYLLDGRNGTALGNRNPRSVSSRLLHALLTPDRLAAMARQARRMVQRRYSWSQTVAAIDRVYTAVA